MCKEDEYGPPRHRDSNLHYNRLLREKPTPRPMGHAAGSDITECNINLERLNLPDYLKGGLYTGYANQTSMRLFMNEASLCWLCLSRY